MQMPSLPTDNLYKFQAIAGLTILILSSWYLCDRLDDVWLQVSKTELEMKTLDIQVKFFQRDSDEYNKQNGTNSAAQVASDSLQKVQIFNKTQEYQIKVAELESKVKFLRYIWNKLLLLSGFSFCVFWWSIKLTRRGFKNWYDRIQIYQDKILKNEAEKHTKSS